MISPFQDWVTLRRRLKDADLVVLLLDFDGTLSRIVKRPEQARMDKEVSDVLRRLAQNPKARIAFISGRSLADLKKKVPLSKIFLAGCHGLEIRGPGMRFVHPEASQKRRAIREMARALRRALSGIPDALVEEKGLSVAAHYRMVPKSRVLTVREAIQRIVAAERGKWKIIHGKQVLEILPQTDWTKGSCVKKLLSLYQAELPSGGNIVALYLGDDLTDQDGFEAVKGCGVSIAVGERAKLRADYFLRDMDEVRSFLEEIEKDLLAGQRP